MYSGNAFGAERFPNKKSISLPRPSQPSPPGQGKPNTMAAAETCVTHQDALSGNPRGTSQHSHGHPSARCRSGAVPGAVTGSEGIEAAGYGTGLLCIAPPRPVPAHQDPPAPRPLPPPPRSLNRLFDAGNGGTERAVTAATQLAPGWGCTRLPASLRARRTQAASKGPRHAKSPGDAMLDEQSYGSFDALPRMLQKLLNSITAQRGRRRNAMELRDLPPQRLASRAFQRPLPYGSAFLPHTEEATGDLGSLQSINSSAVKGDFKRSPERRETAQEIN